MRIHWNVTHFMKEYIARLQLNRILFLFVSRKLIRSTTENCVSILITHWSLFHLFKKILLYYLITCNVRYYNKCIFLYNNTNLALMTESVATYWQITAPIPQDCYRGFNLK